MAIREVVQDLCNDKAGGLFIICAERIKQWLCDMVEEEEKGTEGKGDK